MKSIRSFALLALVGVPLIASAQSLGGAEAYNVFAFGSFTRSSSGQESEGRLAVQGSFVPGSGFNVGIHLPSYDAAHPDALVLGTSSNWTGNQVKGGNVNHVAGTTATNYTYFDNNNVFHSNLDAGRSVVSTVTSSFFTDQQAFSLAQSAQLAALTTSTIALNGGGQYAIAAGSATNKFTVGGHNGYAFVMPSSQFGHDKFGNVGKMEVAISGLATDTVVINVTGDSLSQGMNLSLSGGISADHILWNFTGGSAATKGTWNLTNSQFYGNVLAPNFNVNLDELFTGSLIANDVVLGAHETHIFGNQQTQFNGFLPTPQVVPEPGMLAALGLGAAALLRRRRK